MPANLLAVPAVAPATVLGVLAAVRLPGLAGAAPSSLAWLATLAGLVAGRRSPATARACPAAPLPWPGGAVGRRCCWRGLTVALLLVAARRPLVRRLVLVVGGRRGRSATLPVRLARAGLAAARLGRRGLRRRARATRWCCAAGAGAAVVVDAGPDPAPVDGCLRRLGVAAVPLLVLSHFHADHVGGLAGVLRGRRVGRSSPAGPASRAGGRDGPLVRAGAARRPDRGRSRRRPAGRPVGAVRLDRRSARREPLDGHPVRPEQQLAGAARHGRRGADPARRRRRDRGAAGAARRRGTDACAPTC